jgi:hypothetical protein
VRLADLQADIAAALTDARTPECEPLLIGGARPGDRFAIHQRHYRSSLARAIVERFPATVWLTGSDFVAHAAAAFVRARPPARPCIAEYGDSFPTFLAAQPEAARLPYLAQFATIDWHLGRLAVAIDAAPIALRIDWALDELFTCFLGGRAPDQFTLRAETVWLELHGERGELSLRRLSAPHNEA